MVKRRNMNWLHTILLLVAVTQGRTDKCDWLDHPGKCVHDIQCTKTGNELYIFEDCDADSELLYPSGNASLKDPKCSFLTYKHGVMVLAEKLDAENRDDQDQTNGCKIEVDDPLHPTFIFVLDVNEYPPSLVNGSDVSTVSVKENTAQEIAQFNYTDDDKALFEVSPPYIEGALLGAEIVDKDLASLFTIQAENTSDTTTFTVSVQKLDYEARMSYYVRINIYSVDQRGTMVNATHAISLTVEDVGDMPPTWVKISFPQKFSEGIAGRNVTQVEAIDGDKGVNNAIQYSIIAGNEEGYFDVNETTGEIRNVKDINREDLTDTTFSLKIFAEELVKGGVPAPPPNNSTTEVDIYITDVDNELPRFGQNAYEIQMPELTGSNYPIFLSVFVYDMDEGESGEYTITSDYNDDLDIQPRVSRLNTTLSLTAKWREGTIFDYEVNQDPIEITLTAIETANNSHVGTALLTVNLTDLNDNYPIFSEPQYSANISETEPKGYLVKVIEATDADISENFGNQSIRYSLNSCPQLDINEVTGEVTLAETNAIDYERFTKVSCEVRAQDLDGEAQGNSNVSTVVINVIDVDDTPPRILSLPPHAEIKENSDEGTEVTSEIKGEDEDKGANVHFYIDWTNSSASLGSIVVDPKIVVGWFSIETVSSNSKEYSAVVKVGAIVPDREVADSVYLYIVMVDNNTEYNSKQDYGILPITIKDVKDCPPLFENPDKTNFSLTENSMPTYLIAEFSAEDPDLDDPLSFNISDSSLVDLDVSMDDPTTAKLRVAKGAVIDREKRDSINVTISVTDSIGMEDELDITIHIEDVNDNTPKMLDGVCNQNKSIAEVPGIPISGPITKNGSIVWNFTATDRDVDSEHSRVTYILSNEQLPDSKNRRIPFKIDENTGILSIFLDPDNGKILDRDRSQEDTYWDIFIKANDHCNKDELGCTVHVTEACQLHINVLDVNDNAPGNFDWTSAPKAIEVNEFLKKGDFAVFSDPDNFYTIRAHDNDKPGTVNSTLTYQVLAVSHRGANDSLGLFEAVTSNNEDEDFCRLRAKKNFTHLTGEYDIHIMAKDSGNPPLNGTKVIPLTIDDSNDYTPVFGFMGCLGTTNQTVTMVENTVGLISVCYNTSHHVSDNINIHVTDDDLGDNAKLNVSIDLSKSKEFSNGNQTGDFGIRFKKNSKDQCELVANKLIDREQGNMYNLSIHVEDAGSPPLDSYSWIQIIVTNQFEYPPYFCINETFCNQTISMKENDTMVSASFESATDLDNKNVDPSDPNNYDVIYYGLSGGYVNNFKVPRSNETTLQVTNALDRETKDRYVVYIDTFNFNGAPDPIQTPKPRNFTLYLYINVIDINDNPPVFEKPTIFGSFTQNDKNTSLIMTVQASDVDLNEKLVYSLKDDFKWNDGGPSSHHKKPFVVQAAEHNTARLLLNFDPTGVNSGYCTFTVLCKDNDGTHTGTTQAKIFAITVQFIIPVYFDNDQGVVQTHKSDIEGIFSKVYGYHCTVDGIDKTKAKDGTTVKGKTTVEMHFIDYNKNKPVSKEVILTASVDDRVTSQLQNDLERLGLTLTSIGDEDIHNGDNSQKIMLLEILIGVVSFVLMSLIVLLMLAYCVRTRSLERQVKVLSTTAFGSHSSGLNRLSTEMSVIPGSNKFLGQGSNPLFNLEEANLRNDDGESVDSGDSVLVGVEDNPEFKNYGTPQGSFDVGHDNPVFSRTVDDVTVKDPFAGGMKSNPLLDIDEGVEEVDLSEALQNYMTFVHRDTIIPEDEPSAPPSDDNFTYNF